MDHIDDVESDLSVLHRIDDPGPLPADRVYRLAHRLVHYQGAVRAAAAAEHARARQDEPDGDAQWVDGTATALSASPLATVISTATV